MKWLFFIMISCGASWALPITSGTIVSGTGETGGNYFLQGENFSLSFYGYGGLRRFSVPVGTTISGSYWTNDFGGASGTVDGVSYPLLRITAMEMPGYSTLQVSVVPLTITGAGTFYSTFELTGQICGYLLSGPSRPCDVLLPNLTGSGLYTVTTRQIDNPDGTSYVERVKATYTFGIPEPATGWMIAAGLGLIAVGRRVAARPRS